MNAVTLVLILYCVAVLAEDTGKDSSITKPPKVQVTRAALHVARSIDPDLTETLNVKTRTGDIATLIVRKRDGKSNGHMQVPISIKSTSVKIVEDKKETGRSDVSVNGEILVPSPVSVSSSDVTVKDEDGWKSLTDHAAGKSLRSSTLGLIITEVKDDGEKITKKQPERAIKIPDPVYIRSDPMYIKGERQQENWKRTKSLMTIDSEGVPVITGVRVPDDEEDKRVVWRNARVINNVLLPKAAEVQPEESKKKEVVKRVLEKQNAKEDEVIEGSFQPIILQTSTNQQPNYKPSNSDTHDRILEYINTVNQKETKRRQDARMIFYPIPPPYNAEGSEIPASIYHQSPAFKPRMLHYTGSSIYPTSLLYSPPSATKTSRISFEEGVRTPVLQYAHPELGVQQAEVDRKQDEFIQDGDSDKETNKHDNSIRASPSKIDTVALTYFSQDIHSDRSPYAYEPGLESDEVPIDNFQETNSYERRPGSEESRQSQSWPQKSLSYLYQQQEDSYGSASDKYIKRFPYNGYQGKEIYNRAAYTTQYPNKGHEYYAVYRDEDKPFWERIGETIKEHVQVGMEKMSDLTRPVVEPLVEATHKISRNLGFTSYSNGEEKSGTIQDKVGTTAAAYPVLLPALGLMAGGAALGLGAVAVGRYLDVDSLKRELEQEDEEEKEELKMEHKRAIEGISRSFGAQNGQGKWILASVPVKNSGKRQYQEIVRNTGYLESKVDKDHETSGNGQYHEVFRRNGYLSSKTDHEESHDDHGEHSKPKKEQGENVVFIIEEEKPEEKPKDTPKHILVKRIPQIIEKAQGKNKVPHVIIIEEDGVSAEAEVDHRVRKRSADSKDDEILNMDTKYNEEGTTYLNGILQHLETSPDKVLASMAHLGLVGDWSDTTCAKKMFCDFMAQQSEDSIVLMEKKMATFLALVRPNDAASSHLNDVMNSVKRRDCSLYSCQHVISTAPSFRSDTIVLR